MKSNRQPNTIISQAKQGQACLVLRRKTLNECHYPLHSTGGGAALFLAGILFLPICNAVSQRVLENPAALKSAYL